MELDELKEKWTEYDRELESTVHLKRQFLSVMKTSRARSSMHRLALLLACGSAIWLACIIVLGNFIYEHITQARFALPAFGLDLFAIAALAIGIKQIVFALQVDYAQPITTIQKQLESLRILRIRYIQIALPAGVLLWQFVVIVLLKGFYGVDAYKVFPAAWIVGNLLFGVVVIALVLWVSKKYGDRVSRSPVIQRLMKDLGGYNLNAATDFLEMLSGFERQPSALG